MLGRLRLPRLERAHPGRVATAVAIALILLTQTRHLFGQLRRWAASDGRLRALSLHSLLGKLLAS
jgi:hypothetical protein